VNRRWAERISGWRDRGDVYVTQVTDLTGRGYSSLSVALGFGNGAVGSLVGQIAKLKGCRVVGIAGGPEKCAWIVEELGFDAAIDYKSEDVNVALREHCPEGVDVYFDNVGGDILDAALARLARGARVVICGAISQYNNLDAVKGPSNYMSLLVNRARMQGYISSVFASAAILGPVVGAFIIITMEMYLAQTGSWVTIIEGMIFVVCVLTFRRGIVGVIAPYVTGASSQSTAAEPSAETP